MKPRTMGKPIFFTLFFAITTVVAGGWAWLESAERGREQAQAAFERKRLALLENENERLRSVLDGHEKAGREAQETAVRREIEEAAARLRGLSFRKPVDYNTLHRSEVKEVVLRKIAEQYTDDEFEAIRRAYIALGLLPEGYDLKAAYVNLLGEQIAAFYDQHAGKLFMFEDARLESLNNRVILAHELVHALQDQHYNLRALPLELKTNDDRAIAAAAVVEGDATAVMNQYMLENISARGLGQTFASLFTQSIEELQAAPRLLRETLLFPYTEGLKFCMTVLESEGSLDEVYRDVPESTTQILHPERYFAGERPIPVEWPSGEVLGTAPVADNVLGELGTRILLSDWGSEAGAAEIAAGWRGDRYRVFRTGGEGAALAWRTLWRTPEAREAFVAAATEMWARRYRAKPLAANDGVTPFESGAGRVLRLVRLPEKNAVLLVDAPDEPWADALRERFGK